MERTHGNWGEARRLGPEILDYAVDALCCVLAPFVPPDADVDADAGADQNQNQERQFNDSPDGTALTLPSEASSEADDEEALDSAGSGGVEGAMDDDTSSSEDGWTPTVGAGGGRLSLGSYGSFMHVSGSLGKARRSLSPSKLPRPRRHHLVLRLCGKVLASLARPSTTSSSSGKDGERRQSWSRAAGSSCSDETLGDNAAIVSEDPPAGVSAAQPAAARCHQNGNDCENAESFVGLSEDARTQHGNPPQEKAGIGEREGEAVERRRLDKVLGRVGEALTTAAKAVMSWMEGAEGASIVAFEEEVREHTPSSPGVNIC